MVFVYILIAFFTPLLSMFYPKYLLKNRLFVMLVSFSSALLALLNQLSSSINLISAMDYSTLLDVSPYMVKFYYIFIFIICGLNYLSFAYSARMGRAK